MNINRGFFFECIEIQIQKMKINLRGRFFENVIQVHFLRKNNERKKSFIQTNLTNFP